MDFSKTRLYQRTRSGYEKLYLDYNQKKLNGRRNGGTADGLNTESDGDRVTARVCDDVDNDKINAVSRRTRHACRRNKNLKQVHLIDESENDDDDDGGSGGGIQNHVSSGVEDASASERGKSDDGRGGRKKKSKFGGKVVLGIARSIKEKKSSRTKDSQQNSAGAEDALSYPGDSCRSSKRLVKDAGKSGKGKGGFGDEFDENSRNSSLSSGRFSLGESEDEEGVVFLGQDAACLDDYDPSHSSRVASNEVKLSPVELDSFQADTDAKLQGVRSSEEDEPQKPVSPEEDGGDWRDSEPVENNAAAGSKEVISLTSSSDSEDGEKDENAMGDDGSDVLEVDNNDELSVRFFAKLLQKHLPDKGHEEANDDCEPPLFNSKPVCEPGKKEKVKFSEPVVSKKRYGSSNEMRKPIEGESKKRRTNNIGEDDNFWQVVDEKGSEKAERITSKKYDQFGNRVNVMQILTDAIREEGDGDALLKKYVDIPPEENFTEKTPVYQVQSYKFKFEDEEDIKPEKSEREMEVDGLFDEMNMCLHTSEIGCSTSGVNRGDADFLLEGIDQATCCQRGKHKLTINDEFGIICRYCSYVAMEVRDILPPLSKNGRGGHGRHDHDKTGNTKFSDLKLGECHEEHLLDSEGSEYEKGTVWDLVPGVRESMYPHQRDGFEFIWTKIVGSTYIDKLQKRLPAGGSGCIISHAPGTGKSRLTIVFLQAFLKMYPTAKPLIIAPRSMLLTWEEEFKKWNVDFPFYNLNNTEFSGQEHKVAATFLKQAGSLKSPRQLRLIKLLSWKKVSSVLGITYRLFESLAGDERKRKRAVNNVEDEQVKNFLLQVPTLLVLDEGHTPRNDQSLMWKALLNVKTKRSIILSGTPFQNNFDELYNTLCLVNPLLSFGISSLNGVDFSRKREWKHSSAKGHWDSITSSIKRKNQHSLQELRAMIDPFLHVHKGSILQERLPGLRDALVVLKPTKTQQTLLSKMLGLKPTLENDHLMSLVSVHPSLVPKHFINEGFQKLLKVFENDPHAGVKTHFLMELINLSGAHNEKVLVFSQFIKPLEFIMQLLKTNLKWVEGRECLYMDGQKEEKHRQASINALNDPKSEVKVLLASLKACSEGINLVGASRVVLLDVHWNPSVERQAISRAYRLGQKKLVHVYHLVTGSMEGEKYIRQVEKSHLSELVFSSENKDSSNPKISSIVSKDKILEEMVHHEKLRNMFEKVIYQPKEADLIDTFG